MVLTRTVTNPVHCSFRHFLPTRFISDSVRPTHSVLFVTEIYWNLKKNNVDFSLRGYSIKEVLNLSFHYTEIYNESEKKQTLTVLAFFVFIVQETRSVDKTFIYCPLQRFRVDNQEVIQSHESFSIMNKVFILILALAWTKCCIIKVFFRQNYLSLDCWSFAISSFFIFLPRIVLIKPKINKFLTFFSSEWFLFLSKLSHYKQKKL